MPFVSDRTGRRPRAWSAADDPDNVSGLGDTTTAREPAVIAAWRAAVATHRTQWRVGGAAGTGAWQTSQNVATRMPSGPSTGQLAERYRDQYGALRYSLAPATVRAADQAIGQQIDQDIQAGRTAQIIEQAPATAADAIQRLATGTAQAAGGAARGVIGGVLGIPQWLVPVALGAAGLFVLDVFAPGLNPFKWGGRR